ncbi:hypothetical protein AB0C70_27040 [Streptomyces sp. NPDC048564]|uniref:hypothetical protein n=1 Tax=Streptomyces sp. NPDC048564 TaxID=3155760 RepID=UPI00343F0636
MARTQYKPCSGSLTVPRAGAERLEDGADVQVGVFLSNSKRRRDKPFRAGWPSMASSFPLQGRPGRYEPRVRWVVTFRGHSVTALPKAHPPGLLATA